MDQLTFGEQLKIVLGRRKMTIKELAERIEEVTGKKMSRQNLTQRIGRDNFQEQDMRMICETLGIGLTLDILGMDTATTAEPSTVKVAADTVVLEKSPVVDSDSEESVSTLETINVAIPANSMAADREQTISDIRAADDGASGIDITVGELVRMQEELDALEQENLSPEEMEQRFRTEGILMRRIIHQEAEATKEVDTAMEGSSLNATNDGEVTPHQVNDVKDEEAVSSPDTQATSFTADESVFDAQAPVEKAVANDEIVGEINPYTGKEYESNTVRSHPTRIAYVQVYDRSIHKWMDMTEWAFKGYQERKKNLLKDKYEPPHYLD